MTGKNPGEIAEVLVLVAPRPGPQADRPPHGKLEVPMGSNPTGRLFFAGSHSVIHNIPYDRVHVCLCPTSRQSVTPDRYI